MYTYIYKQLQIKNEIKLLNSRVFSFVKVCIVCCETIKSLTLVNITKMNYTLLHPGTFINLQRLTISPQVREKLYYLFIPKVKY